MIQLLVGQELVFGREEPTNVLLKHPSCSRRHATIRVDELPDGGWNVVLVDVGSSVGTDVDENRIKAEKEVILPEGSKIHFGDCSRIYLLEGATGRVSSKEVDERTALASAQGPAEDEPVDDEAWEQLQAAAQCPVWDDEAVGESDEGDDTPTGDSTPSAEDPEVKEVAPRREYGRYLSPESDQVVSAARQLLDESKAQDNLNPDTTPPTAPVAWYDDWGSAARKARSPPTTLTYSAEASTNANPTYASPPHAAPTYAGWTRASPGWDDDDLGRQLRPLREQTLAFLSQLHSVLTESPLGAVPRVETSEPVAKSLGLPPLTPGIDAEWRRGSAGADGELVVRSSQGKESSKYNVCHC